MHTLMLVYTCVEVRKQLLGCNSFLPPCEFKDQVQVVESGGKCLYLPPKHVLAGPKVYS